MDSKHWGRRNKGGNLKSSTNHQESDHLFRKSLELNENAGSSSLTVKIRDGTGVKRSVWTSPRAAGSWPSRAPA